MVYNNIASSFKLRPLFKYVACDFKRVQWVQSSNTYVAYSFFHSMSAEYSQTSSY